MANPDSKAFNYMTAAADKTDVQIPLISLHEQYVQKARNLRKGHVRPNYDEKGERIGESTVKMSTEFMEGRWVSFPTLYKEKSGQWKDYLKGVPREDEKGYSREKEWAAKKSAYERAKKDNEVFDFGKNEKEAIAFGLGSWKPK
jgi:hypothetical protein